MAQAILSLGLLVFLAHLFTAIFKRTRIPDVLLLMGLGLVIGPGLHLVEPADFGKVGNVMSILALIVILFESGTTLTPGLLARAIRPTLALTVPTFVITGATAYLVTLYGLQLDPAVAWMSGAILGGVSAAVAIPLVKSMGVRDPWGTALVMESALGDVLCIVILLGLVQAFVSGQMAPARIVGAVISSLFMASVIGVLGGIGWMLVLNQVRQFPNTAFTTLAAVFILYGVADELGFSGAITALAFGATLANHRLFSATGWELFSESRLARIEHGDMSFFLEVLFLLKTFFFVYLGMSIHFKDLNLLLWAGVFCGVVYTLRLLVVKVTFSGSEANLHERSLASVMVPKGLVSAVLAGIPVDAGIPGAEAVQEFTYMVVLWSIFATAVLIPLQDRSLLRPFYRWVLGGEETA